MNYDIAFEFILRLFNLFLLHTCYNLIFCAFINNLASF